MTDIPHPPQSVLTISRISMRRGLDISRILYIHAALRRSGVAICANVEAALV